MKLFESAIQIDIRKGFKKNFSSGKGQDKLRALNLNKDSMSSNDHPAPKNPVSHLQMLNLIVALLAGLITVAGGAYSLHSKWFAPKNGILEGTVRDEQIDKPLWKVPVEVTDLGGAVVAAAESDMSGHFQIDSLPEGSYTIKVSALRHAVESKNIKIIPAGKTTVIFDLKPEDEAKMAPIPSEIPKPYQPPQAQIPAAPVYHQPPQETTAPYGAPLQEQEPEIYRRVSYHRRPSSTSYYGGYDRETASDSNIQQTSSQGSLLTQVVGQLLQSAVAKKSENAAGSDSSSASATSSSAA